jgi:hypothetical protein
MELRIDKCHSEVEHYDSNHGCLPRARPQRPNGAFIGFILYSKFPTMLCEPVNTADVLLRGHSPGESRWRSRRKRQLDTFKIAIFRINGPISIEPPTLCGSH